MKNDKIAVYYAFAAVFFWSTIATAFKIALRFLSFYELLLISSLVSTIFYLIVLLIQNKFNQSLFSKKHFFSSMIMGALNPFLYYLILFKAYSLLPAYVAQPLNYTWPIVLTFFSAFFLNQPLKTLSIIAFIISFIGVIFLSKSDQSLYNQNSISGIILAIGSSFIWASYWILNIKDERPALVKLFLNFAFGTIYSFLFVIIVGFKSNLELIHIIPAVYVGIFEMGLTFFLWLMALEKSSRTDKISIFIFLSPLLSLLFIYFILHEHITFLAILGFIFIMTGIITLKFNEIKESLWQKTK